MQQTVFIVYGNTFRFKGQLANLGFRWTPGLRGFTIVSSLCPSANELDHLRYRAKNAADLYELKVREEPISEVIHLMPFYLKKHKEMVERGAPFTVDTIELSDALPGDYHHLKGPVFHRFSVSFEDQPVVKQINEQLRSEVAADPACLNKVYKTYTARQLHWIGAHKMWVTMDDVVRDRLLAALNEKYKEIIAQIAFDKILEDI